MKQLLSNEIISINFILPKDNLADLFMKGLIRERIKLHIQENGTKSLTLPSQFNENLTSRLDILQTKFKKKN